MHANRYKFMIIKDFYEPYTFWQLFDVSFIDNIYHNFSTLTTQHCIVSVEKA